MSRFPATTRCRWRCPGIWTFGTCDRCLRAGAPCMVSAIGALMFLTSGTFTAQDGWTLMSNGPSGSTDRCSDNTDYIDTLEPIPGGTGYAPYGQIWNVALWHTPAQGDQFLLPNTQSKSPPQASAST